MSEVSPVQDMPDSVAEAQAHDWLVRLRGAPSKMQQQEFQEWLAQSDTHAAAYKRAIRLFEEANILKQSAFYGIDRDRPARFRLPARLLIAGVVAAAAALVMAVIPTHHDKPEAAPSVLAEQSAPLSTKRGEIRTIRLTEGSHLTLDTGSRVEVSITRQARRLKLLHGHVRFAIASDSRPFLVEAGAGTLSTPRGTEASFDMGYDDGSPVYVMMLSGRAEARPLFRATTWRVPVAPLDAGQATIWTRNEISFPPMDGDISHVDRSQWPTGWVSYHAVAVKQLVAEANRYSDRPIILGDDRLGELQITGRFHVSDPVFLAGRLADVFDLRLEQSPAFLRLRQK